MLRAFWGLAIADLLVLAGALVLGASAHDERSAYQHVGLGVFAALLTCLIHAVVFTYLTATGKMMRQAIALGGIDGDADERIRGFKRTATRGVGVAILTVIVTVASGAVLLSRLDQAALVGDGRGLDAAPTGRSGIQAATSGWTGTRALHWVAGLATLGVSLAAFVVEANSIAGNAALMNEMFAAYEQRRLRRPAIQAGNVPFTVSDRHEEPSPVKLPL